MLGDNKGWQVDDKEVDQACSVCSLLVSYTEDDENFQSKNHSK